MSYAMTHLLVADRFLKTHPADNNELFMLGSIAPDAVHSRPDFTKRIKADSHCLPEEENWGEICKEAPLIKWYGRLRDFWREKSVLASDADTRSFLKGYTLHALTDIYNNAKFYAPCWMKFGLEDVDGFRKAYRNECIIQDNWIMHSDPEISKTAQTLLITTDKYDLKEIISRLGLDKFFTADDLRLSVEYLLKEHENDVQVSLEGLSMVSQKSTEKFISEAENECEQILFDFPDAGRRFCIPETKDHYTGE